MKFSHLVPMMVAVGVTLPAAGLHLFGIQTAPAMVVLTSGTAILGAAFLLLWACDAAQADISQALALAAVALVAVLPEYAVDMYFTWQAGADPASEYAQYAVANMTGANRLLIGVAWGAIAALYWVRFRRDVRLGSDRRMELWFLGLATAYAFIVPIKGTLAWYDGLVFLGLYVWYLTLAARRPCEEAKAFGPAALIVRLPQRTRRLSTALLFLFAGGTILLHAESFCEGLIRTGHALGINEFLLIQWLAPVASEAPEFVVALIFAWRGQANLALGSLLSAKLNQWTLLVGMIPGVFALSHGTLSHPIPMGSVQLSEILLTAAQSLLAVVLLSSLRLTLSGSALLLGLFAGQLLLPGIAAGSSSPLLVLIGQYSRPFFSLLYVTAAVALFLARPRQLLRLREGIQVRVPAKQTGACECDAPDAIPDTASVRDAEGLEAQCTTCRWRLAGVATGLQGEDKGSDLCSDEPRTKTGQTRSRLRE